MTVHNDTSEQGSTSSVICQERCMKVHQIHHNNKSIPWLNIKGQWLEQAGFNIHSPIKIRVMNGCLVITTKEE